MDLTQLNYLINLANTFKIIIKELEVSPELYQEIYICVQETAYHPSLFPDFYELFYKGIYINKKVCKNCCLHK